MPVDDDDDSVFNVWSEVSLASTFLGKKRAKKKLDGYNKETKNVRENLPNSYNFVLL